ncbi:EF-hand domain-containing protein [Pseudotabrizicola algicola]|uniref:Calcium-binding protein n=1 Tax=Pseudotabrizicola algicola TaxID=2709381 RepID=A0A6B3RNN4_9RHOB|nr:EF-hand domain-containing protein [Pseudotabrizicola algicola]NEX45765.1 calcium-binding protein [Pseudotabrizicola algicola]
MIDKNKLVGTSLVALAIALTASAALADRADRMGGMMGPALDFAAIDADQDGKITQAEVTAWRAAQSAALDADGDGLISAEEIAAMHIRTATERAATHADRMIAELDTDGDGKLSAAELAASPMGLRPMTAGLSTRMFERLDTDKDGAISEAELAAAKDRMTERRGARGEGRGGMHRGDHGPRGNN